MTAPIFMAVTEALELYAHGYDLDTATTMACDNRKIREQNRHRTVRGLTNAEREHVAEIVSARAR